MFKVSGAGTGPELLALSFDTTQSQHAGLTVLCVICQESETTRCAAVNDPLFREDLPQIY